MPPVTAKARSQVRLQARTSLDPQSALDLVKQAAQQVRGGGKSLLTSGVANIGAGVHVESETANRINLSINSGKRIVELCTFSARVSSNDSGSELLVGGLETYKTSQSKVFGFIPSGPKSILGYDLYKRYLDAVRAGLLAKDPQATVTIAEPDAVAAGQRA